MSIDAVYDEDEETDHLWKLTCSDVTQLQCTCVCMCVILTLKFKAEVKGRHIQLGIFPSQSFQIFQFRNWQPCSSYRTSM